MRLVDYEPSVAGKYAASRRCRLGKEQRVVHDDEMGLGGALAGLVDEALPVEGASPSATFVALARNVRLWKPVITV